MSTTTSAKGNGGPDDFAFQVNLSGIIELLSHHLYSGPHVYLRELLQNAVDAIQARRQLEPDLSGEINVELVRDPQGHATLVFEDNGIGLTEEEVHKFLSTIGLSSKTEDLARRRGDYIGQFGIGLLAGFMVTDEIVMITRSARGTPAAMEWRGTGDGRYSLKRLESSEARPGTKVFLRARADMLSCFEPRYVTEHLRHFGAMLTDRIELLSDGQRTTINAQPPPWRRSFDSLADWRAACLDFGERVFGLRFLDCLSLRVEEVGLEGVGFIVPVTPSLASRRADRVYVKNMLLTERADDLLPEWAFFTRCVFNATGLNPAASREALQEDDRLRLTRAGLEKNLRSYLLGLARHDHERLREIVRLHYRAIKLLAADDDEFYRLFIDWLPFETSQGEQTLKSVRKENPEIRYAANVDTFRQMAQIAAAQSLCVVNAGYVCDVELLEKLPEVFPDVTVHRLEPSELLDRLEDLSLAEQDAARDAMDRIDTILRSFHCDLEVKRFHPSDLPALYTVGSGANFQRELRRSREQADDLWAGVLDGIGPSPSKAGGHRSQLCLNWLNPVVRKLLVLRNPEVLQRAVELLYVQALLQGHYPLDGRERRVLGDGLTGLIDLALGDQEAA